MQSLSATIAFEGMQNNGTSGKISQQTLEYLNSMQKEFDKNLPNIQTKMMANETIKQSLAATGHKLLSSEPKCILSSPVLRSIEISIPERMSLTINKTIATSSIDVLTRGQDQVSTIPTSRNQCI
jgi:hypothetical protein